MLDRHAGRYSLVVSVSPFLTDPVQRMLSLTPSHVSLAHQKALRPKSRFYLRIVWSEQLSGGVERLGKRSLTHTTIPQRCPKTLLFVPESVRPAVLQWGHSSKLVATIHQRFWWPTRERDIRCLVASCSVCAQTKSSNSPPAGLLRPLPIPSRPWSHIALDFVTGLPPSAGNTVIPTVVDRFSKAVHFIPLPKLPSAKETAQTVFSHVFILHGLPSDVVSDRGPQFASQFWRLCTLADCCYPVQGSLPFPFH